LSVDAPVARVTEPYREVVRAAIHRGIQVVPFDAFRRTAAGTHLGTISHDEPIKSGTVRQH
jgi:hypothetical protein